MGNLPDLIKSYIDEYMTRIPHPRAATVTSYDPKRHAVKAMLQPDGVETGWMPIATAHVGNGFGMAIGAQIDDQIVVGFHEGDIESPYMMGRMHSDKERPPVAEAGEIVIQTATGAVFKFAKDGTVSLHTNGGAFNIDAGGGEIAIISATLTHNGHDIGSTHEHTGVVPGGGISGPPV